MGKFDRFFGNLGENEPRNRTRSRGIIPPIATGLPDGQWVDDGVYRIERLFAIGCDYGMYPMPCPDMKNIMEHFGADGPLVFLDLETTGLAGGSGTYAFLCGLGMSVGGSFRVSQFFLEGPAKEAKWLAAIDASIPPNACLVTYNGKTFDIPLLRTRHILSRSSPAWNDQPHIDLLHHARRLYRGYFDSCSLGSMEKNILGMTRGGEDIPGHLIPSLYAQYLLSKDASPLGGVFYHNQLDIASLAALYGRIADILNGDTPDGRELARAGEIWYAHGKPDRADELWEKASQKPNAKALAHTRRAFYAKKEKLYEKARKEFILALEAMKASDHWTGCDFAMPCTLLEELAKLDEHKFNSPETALRFTQRAQAWLKRNRYLLGHSFTRMNRSLLRRAERLNLKIAKRAQAIADPNE